jgi:hypothetical protein
MAQTKKSAKQQSDSAARAIIAAFEMEGVPTFFKVAIADALDEAAILKLGRPNYRSIYQKHDPKDTKQYRGEEYYNTDVVAKLLRQSTDLFRVLEPCAGSPNKQWRGLITAESILNETDETRARAEAEAVNTFLYSGVPDFLMEAILCAIDNAFDHFKMAKPDSDMGEGTGDYTEENLYPLFLKTKFTNWGDMYSDKQRVLDSVTQLLENPKTRRICIT